MRLLHYTLGFQPKRTGGLVKYVTDLMKQEKADGHEVFALYPSEINIFSKKISIKKDWQQAGAYRLINSLPLALFGGISEPELFMTPCSQAPYKDFLEKIKPDIVHVHSLIGLHKEFFETAHDLGIKIVFTSHDYYGLAPVPHFYFNGKSYDEDNTNLSWNIMSSNALSVSKMRIFQLPFYSLLRNVLKLLGKNPKLRKNIVIREVGNDIDYSSLRLYYREILELIDYFVFNSSLAESVYKKNGISPLKYRIIPITNSSIKKHQHSPKNRGKKVVAYIGPDEEYKGYYEFIRLCENLEKEHFTMKTYGHVPNKECPPYIKQEGSFTSEKLSVIYREIDYLIVPSLCKETFGFVTLEALSYGVPVFVSSSVGAKDLVDDWYIFSNIDEVIEKLHFHSLRTASKYEDIQIKNLAEHSKELENLYKEIL